jgi:hypothetical protein
MKTQSQTTYILLERGVEDVALLKELYDITSRIEYSTFVREFPTLNGMKYLLKCECDYD